MVPVHPEIAIIKKKNAKPSAPSRKIALSPSIDSPRDESSSRQLSPGRIGDLAHQFPRENKGNYEGPDLRFANAYLKKAIMTKSIPCCRYDIQRRMPSATATRHDSSDLFTAMAPRARERILRGLPGSIRCPAAIQFGTVAARGPLIGEVPSALSPNVETPRNGFEKVNLQILCEAPDYVEWKPDTSRGRSFYTVIAFVQLNIVRDSFRADIWSARGDHGTVIEEVFFARRVHCQL